MNKVGFEKIVKQYTELKIDIEFEKEIKSGKEGVVYKVLISKIQAAALKIYFPSEQTSFNRYYDYIEGAKFGTFYKRALKSKNRVGRQFLEKTRTTREFNMLKKFYEKGVSIPRPLAFTDDTILMDFLGEKEPAPRLVDIKITKDLAQIFFDEIINSVETMVKCGVVHGDLSPYNILIWQNKTYIIDFPQAVDIRTNPNYSEFLRRDLNNIVKFFQKYIEINEDPILTRFAKYLGLE